MIMMYVLSLTPIGAAAVVIATANSPEAPYLQYGALGICFIMVLFLCKYIWHLSDLLSKQSDRNEKVIERNTKSNNDLVDCLKDRPCIMGDKRMNG